MTLRDALSSAYAWGVEHGTAVLLASVAIPLLGALAVWLGKRGSTDEDGRVIASLLLGVGVLAVIGELLAVHAGSSYFGGSVLEADAKLVVAPLVCFVGSLVGVRLVFPFSRIAGAKTAADLTLLFACCLGLIWFFSKFRGWGIVFFGSFLQLVVVLAVVAYFMRRLVHRAFNRGT